MSFVETDLVENTQGLKKRKQAVHQRYELLESELLDEMLPVA